MVIIPKAIGYTLLLHSRVLHFQFSPIYDESSLQIKLTSIIPFQLLLLLYDLHESAKVNDDNDGETSPFTISIHYDKD